MISLNLLRDMFSGFVPTATEHPSLPLDKLYICEINTNMLTINS